MNSQIRISDYADSLTHRIVRDIRRHIDSDKLTPEEIRQVELTIAAQLETGKRGMYRETQFRPHDYSVSTNDRVCLNCGDDPDPCEECGKNV